MGIYHSSFCISEDRCLPKAIGEDAVNMLLA